MITILGISNDNNVLLKDYFNLISLSACKVVLRYVAPIAVGAYPITIKKRRQNVDQVLLHH